MKPVTLDDIARACGISKAAVSYILNGRRGAFAVSEQTAKTVLAECERVGYKPDAAAQALSHLKSAPVRILIMSPWLFAQFSDFSARVYTELMRHTDVMPVFEPYIQGELKISAASLKRYDAVIIAGTSPRDGEYLKKHREAFTKVILLNRFVEGFPCSRGDDYEAAKRLGEALKSKYRYFVAVEQTTGAPVLERQRIKGFCEATGARRQSKGVCRTPGLINFFPQYIAAAHFAKYASTAVAAYDIHSLLSRFVDPFPTVDPNIEEMTRRAIDAAREIKENGLCRDIEITKGIIILSEAEV